MFFYKSKPHLFCAVKNIVAFFSTSLSSKSKRFSLRSRSFSLARSISTAGGKSLGRELCIHLAKVEKPMPKSATTLLDLTKRTYARWKVGDTGRIGRDGKARLSNLMGIHKALRIVFNDAARGYAWVKTTNDAFGSRSALDVMMGGEITDIMRVRRYLDAERGAW